MEGSCCNVLLDWSIKISFRISYKSSIVEHDLGTHAASIQSSAPWNQSIPTRDRAHAAGILAWFSLRAEEDVPSNTPPPPLSPLFPSCLGVLSGHVNDRLHTVNVAQR